VLQFHQSELMVSFMSLPRLKVYWKM